MIGVPEFAASVLADAIRRQPLSPGKVVLAWQLAAGPQLARASRIEIEKDAGPSLTLAVRARDRRWAEEIDRVRPMLADRLALLLSKKTLTLHIT
jgi:hypothetical protein